MSGWIDELAQALEVEPLSNPEVGKLLTTAREIAHRAERKDTPLATFLLGLATAERTAAGTPREEAFGAVVAAALEHLPDEPPPSA